MAGPRPQLAEMNRRRSAEFRVAQFSTPFKHCNGCGKDKPRNEFGVNKKTWDQRQSSCIECKRAVDRNTMRRLTRELRAAVVAKLGGICLHCGLADQRALQVDHVHGGGAAESRATRLGTVRYYRKVLADTAGMYQLLCANCNWIKRHEKNETPQRSYQ